ncbi:MAG: ABC transporter permease [Thermoplasmata archaeon]|nr:ABC transporter permease [Thermoplasmata archaeon]
MSRLGPLHHARLQTVLAVCAVAAAVALPVVLLSVGRGVVSHEINALSTSGYQLVVSGPGEYGIVQAHSLARQIDAVPTVAAASPILSVAVDLSAPGGGPVPLLAEGVIPAAFTATLSPQESGLFPNPLPLGDPTDSAHFAGGSYSGPAIDDLLVSTPLASADGLTVGSTVRLALSSQTGNGTAFRITGTFGVPPSIFGSTAAFAGLLPLSDLQLLVGAATNGTSGVIDAANEVDVGLAGSATMSPAAVSTAQRTVQALVPYDTVSALSTEVSQLETADTILTGFYVALSSISLSIGLVFLTVVLLRRVEADRSLMAIRRAIGEPARSLAATWARDAVTMGAAGAVGGVIAGIVVVKILAADGPPTVAQIAGFAVFDPVVLGLLALSVVGLAALVSLAATRRALALPLAEVLRG